MTSFPENFIYSKDASIASVPGREEMPVMLAFSQRKMLALHSAIKESIELYKNRSTYFNKIEINSGINRCHFDYFISPSHETEEL